MTHHPVMTSSLRIKNFKIDKFCDFSCDIDYNSSTGVFRDVVTLIINQCDPTPTRGGSGGHKVSASRTAQASEARLYIYIHCLNKSIRTPIIPYINSYNIVLFSDSMYLIGKRYA